MAKQGKRTRRINGMVNRNEYYAVNDAVQLVKETASAKFDETVEAAIQLGIDARKSDQNVRSSAMLPHGIGKPIRVAVFATGPNAEAALEAGADIVGLDDVIADVQKGNIDFDACIAEPDAVRFVGRLGRILGPRGLMPNLKTNTIRSDIAEAVREAKAGKIDFKIDKAGIIHSRIGKASFDNDALVENLQELVRALKRAQPPAAKGQYIRKISLSTTMGPGVRVDVGDFAQV